MLGVLSRQYEQDIGDDDIGSCGKRRLLLRQHRPNFRPLAGDDSIWLGVRKFKPIIQRGEVLKVQG